MKTGRHYAQRLSKVSEWLLKNKEKGFLCALLTIGLVPRLRDDSVVKMILHKTVQNVQNVRNVQNVQNVQNGDRQLKIEN